MKVRIFELDVMVLILSCLTGGRHTPFVSNYRPQLFTRTADVTAVINLPADVTMVMPGDNVAVDVELYQDVAIENGSRFTVREGGKTVATGKFIAK